MNTAPTLVVNATRRVNVEYCVFSIDLQVQISGWYASKEHAEQFQKSWSMGKPSNTAGRGWVHRRVTTCGDSNVLKDTVIVSAVTTVVTSVEPGSLVQSAV